MTGEVVIPAGISMTGKTHPEIAALTIEISRAATLNGGVLPTMCRIDPERWARIGSELGVVEFRVLGVPVVPEAVPEAVMRRAFVPTTELFEEEFYKKALSAEAIENFRTIYSANPLLQLLLRNAARAEPSTEDDRLMAALRDVARGQ